MIPERICEKTDLYCSDCVDVMRTMPDCSVDLVIADPPYKLEIPEKTGVDDLLREKGITLVNEAWDKFSLDDYLTFSRQWLREAFRIVKPTGSVFVFGSYHNIGLINYIMQDEQWMIINDIAWYKRNAVPNVACRRLTASYESILWAARGKDYVFNYEDMKTGYFPDDHLKKPDKQMRNVWDIPTNGSENVGHPTQKPSILYERIIRMACAKNSDSVVLDPFAGSGTLGVAIRHFAYTAILIEQDAGYQRIIRDRLGAPRLG